MMICTKKIIIKEDTMEHKSEMEITVWEKYLLHLSGVRSCQK